MHRVVPIVGLPLSNLPEFAAVHEFGIGPSPQILRWNLISASGYCGNRETAGQCRLSARSIFRVDGIGGFLAVLDL